MCGICKFIDNSYSEMDLRKINNTISHRGQMMRAIILIKKLQLLIND